MHLTAVRDLRSLCVAARASTAVPERNWARPATASSGAMATTANTLLVADPLSRGCCVLSPTAPSRADLTNYPASASGNRVVTMITGHLTRSVFDRYNIVSEADLKQAAGKLAYYVSTQSPRR